MLSSKFFYLKHLSIDISSALSFSSSYDYFSLVSFLDASPCLETLILDVRPMLFIPFHPILQRYLVTLTHSLSFLSIFQVTQQLMKHESVAGGSSHQRQMPEHHHCCLKSVTITGFSSAKGLVELACYILKNAVSLECLTLDTLYGFRCLGKKRDNLLSHERLYSQGSAQSGDKVPPCSTANCSKALQPVPCQTKVVGIRILFGIFCLTISDRRMGIISDFMNYIFYMILEICCKHLSLYY